MRDRNHMIDDILLRDIIQERDRQDAKWGEQNHDQFKWNAILGEEVGEVANAICENWYGDVFSSEARGKFLHLREELVQVAAVAIAFIQSLDRNELKNEEL